MVPAERFTPWRPPSKPQRGDRVTEQRPDRPGWASLPTMPWSQVEQAGRQDERGRYQVTEPAGAQTVRSQPPTSPATPSDGEPDPEQALAALRVTIDPLTLHEVPENVYELFKIRESLS